MPSKADPPTLPFATQAKWAAWLAKHHGEQDGVWVKFAKKASGIQTVTFQEALDVALCWGWIDGQSRSLDEDWYLQRFTPRRARSTWSKRNRTKALELIESGEMKPPGLAEVERAKADGRWDAAYDSASTITVPDDLRARSMRSRRPPRPSPNWTARTATRSCSASTRRNGPRRAPSGSRSSSPCSARGELLYPRP